MTSQFLSFKYRVAIQYIGHETAISRNPTTDDVTRDRTDLTDSQKAKS
jgi:hypothetical protein